MNILQEYARMCRTSKCGSCKLELEKYSNDCLDFILNEPEKATRIIGEWSENNPIEIDWSKVPIDTKVMVRDSKEDEWVMRYFNVYLPKSSRPYYAFVCDKNRTNATSVTDIVSWRYCKLAEDIDPTPYLKF